LRLRENSHPQIFSARLYGGKQPWGRGCPHLRIHPRIRLLPNPDYCFMRSEKLGLQNLPGIKYDALVKSRKR